MCRIPPEGGTSVDMYKEETKPSNLAKTLLVFNYVFVDTCSLMEDSFPAFMDLLVKSRSYWKGELKVVILGEVIEELKKHSANREKPDLRVSALRALKIINHDKARLFGRTFEIWKSKSNDGFLDNALYTIVSGLRIKNKILVITQDKTLARELRNMNNLESQRGRYIIVDRINENSELEENPGDAGNKFQSRKNGGVNAPKQLTDKKERKELPAPKDVKELKHTPKIPESLQIIQNNDKRINNNLSNNNYPNDKKINDINSQLSLLSKENKKDIASLNLTYDEQKLREILKKLMNSQDKKPIEPKVAEITKSEQNKPQKEKEPQKVWFEYGSTPLAAAIKACTAKSIIPHKKEIEYVRLAHGEANIVIEELDLRLGKFKFEKVGESHELRFNSYVVTVEKTEKDYKASLEKKEIVKKEPVKEPKANAPKKEVVEVKPVEVKTPEPAVVIEPKPVEVKEEVKPIDESKAKPVEKAPSKPKAKKKPSTPKPKEEKKPETQKQAESPVEEPKVAKEETSLKPKAAKPVKKKEQAKTKPAESKENKTEKRSPELEDALASEKTLKCNINNSTYPKDSKIKDIETHLAKIRALKENDRRKLGLGIRELQHQLSELKK